jgi:sucrose phosphorylase
MVQKQIELMRLRNTHPAFAGEFQVDVPVENQIQLQWSLQKHWVKLHVDLSVPSASITGTGIQTIAIPDAVDHGVQF